MLARVSELTLGGNVVEESPSFDRNQSHETPGFVVGNADCSKFLSKILELKKDFVQNLDQKQNEDTNAVSGYQRKMIKLKAQQSQRELRTQRLSKSMPKLVQTYTGQRLGNEQQLLRKAFNKFNDHVIEMRKQQLSKMRLVALQKLVQHKQNKNSRECFEVWWQHVLAKRQVEADAKYVLTIYNQFSRIESFMLKRQQKSCFLQIQECCQHSIEQEESQRRQQALLVQRLGRLSHAVGAYQRSLKKQAFQNWRNEWINQYKITK